MHGNWQAAEESAIRALHERQSKSPSIEYEAHWEQIHDVSTGEYCWQSYEIGRLTH
jgi:hypothetical protein